MGPNELNPRRIRAVERPCWHDHLRRFFGTALAGVSPLDSQEFDVATSDVGRMRSGAGARWDATVATLFRSLPLRPGTTGIRPGQATRPIPEWSDVESERRPGETVGARRRRLARTGMVRGPADESTFRCVLARLDASALDRLLGTWAVTKAAVVRTPERVTRGRWRPENLRYGTVAFLRALSSFWIRSSMAAA
ncbi:hypothetical protein GCM10028784_06310 [Myceligenerans cantabricum]